MNGVSVVIPAYNEGGAVASTVEAVRGAFERAGVEHEIIVVNDGSKDTTGQEATEAGARVVSHPVNIGYGNAILTGLHAARYPIVGLTDADGTYPVDELPRLARELDERGLDMLVGIRQGKHFHGSVPKRLARMCFRALAEFASGQTIPDINSGLRVMRRQMMLDFAPVACGGFSYTTTLTVISLLTSRFVAHTPIQYHARHGASKVRYVRDTLRSAQILVMAILLYNPIKLFLLLAVFSAAALALLSIPSFALGGPISGFATLGLSTLSGAVCMGLGFLAEQRRSNAPPRHGQTAQPAGVFGARYHREAGGGDAASVEVKRDAVSQLAPRSVETGS